MSEHTPGPWQLARYDAERHWIELETVERGTDLPDQGYTLAIIYGGPSSGNARLIAAAPELYAACRAALRRLYDPYLGEDDGERQQPEIEMLSAVIAKVMP